MWGVAECWVLRMDQHYCWQWRWKHAPSVESYWLVSAEYGCWVLTYGSHSWVLSDHGSDWWQLVSAECWSWARLMAAGECWVLDMGHSEEGCCGRAPCPSLLSTGLGICPLLCPWLPLASKVGIMSSILCPVSSVLCPLSSVLCPLSSVLRPVLYF